MSRYQGNKTDLIHQHKLFKERWLEVSGEYISVDSESQLTTRIRNFIQTEGLDSIVISHRVAALGREQLIPSGCDLKADFRTGEYSSSEATQACAGAAAGLTTVDALIASTGTLIIASQDRGDRLCSSLPPVHLAVILNQPIFPDLDAFLSQCDQNQTWCFITGPSRTADIEKTLVLGAHGPARVVVFGLA